MYKDEWSTRGGSVAGEINDVGISRTDTDADKVDIVRSIVLNPRTQAPAAGKLSQVRAREINYATFSG